MQTSHWSPAASKSLCRPWVGRRQKSSLEQSVVSTRTGTAFGFCVPCPIVSCNSIQAAHTTSFGCTPLHIPHNFMRWIFIHVHLAVRVVSWMPYNYESISSRTAQTPQLWCTQISMLKENPVASKAVRTRVPMLFRCAITISSSIASMHMGTTTSTTRIISVREGSTMDVLYTST